MATLYITEHVAVGGTSNFNAQGAFWPPAAQQTLAITSSSEQSNPFTVNTVLIRVHNDAAGPCSINIGPNPTATASDARMAANQTEYFAVVPGQKIAVISNT